MSPFTVAMMIFPRDTPVPPPFFCKCRRTISKHALAASALCSSCGKNKIPFSYCRPTTSSAGISVSDTSASASVVCKSAWVHCRAGSFNPFKMQSAMSGCLSFSVCTGCCALALALAKRSIYAWLPTSIFLN